MENFEVMFYEKSDGTKPVEEFLDSLDIKMRAKMLKTIVMLKNNGYELREPYSKSLSDGIFELRTQVGTDITRVLYFFVVGKKAILTNGFIKKTNKTPPNEIEKAKQYRSEYLSREEENQND
ncbi:MAG: type II toxin-antitoxin system RelE/ParE family toxin [Acutalibacteraceae bacterium]